MLVDYLQDSKKPISQEHYKSPIIVKFNPWYFSGQEHLIRQFFNVLSSNLDSSIEKMGQELKDGLSTVGKSMKTFAKILEPVNKFVVPFIPVPLLGETTEGLQKLMDSVSSAIVGDGEESSIDPIKLKENISEQLKKIDKKILIIIDDIDRLNKNEIKQIFQLVKSLADFPNTIYLLSFSPEVVTQSLEEVQGGDSRKYLEKIVQYPIEIPLISQRNLEHFLYNGISKIVQNGNLDQNLYNEKRFETIFNDLDFRFYFTNLREILRFLNIFRFNFDLIGDEVNTVDLMIISGIQSLDMKMYSFIKNNKELFVGGKDRIHLNNSSILDTIEQNQRKGNNNNDKIIKNQRLNGIELLDHQELIYRQYKFIKPVLNFIFNDSSQEQSAQQRSIGCIDHFDCYFQLSLPDNKMSYLEINSLLNLIETPDQFVEVLNKYKNSDKLFSLIQEFSIYIGYFVVSDRSKLCKLINSLICFNEEIRRIKFNNKFLNNYGIYPLIEKILIAVFSRVRGNKILERLTVKDSNTPHSCDYRYIHNCHSIISDDRHNYEKNYLLIFKEILNISPGYLSFSYLCLLNDFGNKIFLYQGYYKRNIEQINKYKYAIDFIQLEEMMLDKIKANVKNQNIFESQHFVSFMSFWEQFENQEITQQVTDLINSDKHCFLKFLIICYFGNEKPDKTFLNRFISDQNCLKQIPSIKEDKVYWDSLNELEKQIIDKAYSVIFNSNKN